MAKRALTIQTFIKKATTTNSAAGFLSQYREYLTTGEIASVASPLIAQIDCGNLDADIGLEQITSAVFAHMLELSLQKAEASLIRSTKKTNGKSGKTTSVSKNYIAIVYNGETEVESKGFDLPQQAQHYADRRLSDGGPFYNAIVKHTKSNYQEIILRDDSLSRLNRRAPGSVLKRRPINVSRLSGVMSAKQDHCHFSHG